jgi:hypothetical protein
MFPTKKRVAPCPLEILLQDLCLLGTRAKMAKESVPDSLPDAAPALASPLDCPPDSGSREEPSRAAPNHEVPVPPTPEKRVEDKHAEARERRERLELLELLEQCQSLHQDVLDRGTLLGTAMTVLFDALQTSDKTVQPRTKLRSAVAMYTSLLQLQITALLHLTDTLEPNSTPSYIS